MQRTPSARYTLVAILLHWVMAGLILFMILLGWNMDDNPARLQLHKSIGITILFLTATRILWRMKNPVPPLPADYSGLEVMLARLVHLGFYVLMIAVPLGGWVLVSISEIKVPTVLYGSISWPALPVPGFLHSEMVYGAVEFLHSKGAWGFIILLVLHVAGALKHEFAADEEGVLKRVLPGLFGHVLPPRRARGYMLAIGGVLLAFALIAFITGSARLAASDVANPVSSVLAEPLIVDNWDVDYDSSEIRFTGLHEGAEFTGTFRNWSANVAFYPEDLNASEVRVTIDTTSADAGRKLYTESLPGGEWFDTPTFPQARVHVSNFRETDEGYAADARIRVKTSSMTVPLTFTLDIDGDTAHLHGHAVVTRKGLNLGQASDPGSLWVSDDITVTVSGRATRK